MSEKSKPKTAKKRKAPAQQSVLGNLPATRPSRLARRHAEPEPAKVEATEAPVPATPAATDPRATEPAKKAGTRTTRAAAPRRAAAKAKPAATAKRPRPKPEPVAAAAEAPKTFKPTAAATEAASPISVSAEAQPSVEQGETPAPETFDRTAASGRASARGPRPVRAGSPSLGRPARREPAPPPANGSGPRGTELFTTAIQAAGELTKIGITVGSQIAKRALDRLPRR
jgi:hypothetical protein